jgi:glycosyltransferase involved in cell wall biosynthesis
LSIYSQQFDHNLIEIIVSDNCSDDDTPEIAKKFKKYKSFNYYRQENNLGVVKNIIKLVNDYAKGEYCWVIGDDDFPLSGSISTLIELLCANIEIDFFYLKISHMFLDEYDKYNDIFHTSLLTDNVHFGKLKYRLLDKWEELLSRDYSIVFLGEIQGSVFRRVIWLQYKNINLEGAHLETLETTYPHTVVWANTFFGKKAIYVETPMILVLNGAREWWHKVDYVIIVQVRNLIKLYKSKGLDKHILKKCYKSYIEISFPSIKNYISGETSIYREKVSILNYFVFCFYHSPLFMIKVLKNEVKLKMAENLVYRKSKAYLKHLILRK